MNIPVINEAWSKLSVEAKSVIEWIYNPYTDKPEQITIIKNAMFSKIEPYHTDEPVNIKITEKLYDEIKQYVTTYGYDLAYKEDENLFVFWPKEKYKNFSKFMNEPE